MNETLFTPINMPSENNDEKSSKEYFFISFLCKLEGWKTKCKNLHWAAPNRSIHLYLDDFLVVLSDYQDGLAEGYMGILGQMEPNVIKGYPCDCTNALDFIKNIKEYTMNFYNSIPNETVYKGITSECETFIQQLNKYEYLFKLCF